MKRLLCSALWLGSVACGGSGADLRVDVRSDWVAGIEVTEVVARLGDEEIRNPVAQTDDLSEGLRAARFEGVAKGTQRVFLELRGPSGVVGAREAVVDVRGPTGVTLLITRNCAGVTCDDPAANQCLDGRCVAPTCTLEAITECGAPSCAGALECVATSACVTPQCVGGACLQSGGSCGTGEYCDPEAGCRSVPRVDAGVDAGIDAAVDAGVDAGIDAGEDSGVDAGVDSGPGVDAGMVACGDHEPDDVHDDGLARGTLGSIDGSDTFTSGPLGLCGADQDWIAVQTVGLVRVTVTLEGLAPSTSTVCLELSTYSDLMQVVAEPPISAAGPTCAAVAPGDFLTLGPVSGTLVGGPNYVMAHVTFSDARDDVAYRVRFDGMPVI